MEFENNASLEYTPTWVVAIVCSVIVLISLIVERALHQLGKFLTNKKQGELFAALQRLKEELMLLGFISLLLTVFQGLISRMCMPTYLSTFMIPCEMNTISSNGSEHFHNQLRLFSEDRNSGHCLHEGKVSVLSMEALHQLHIFIFVLAIVHVIFCVTTMFLGGIRIRQWKLWEDSIKSDLTRGNSAHARDDHEFMKVRAIGYWRKAAVVSWFISLFKQFYGSVTKSDYKAMRKGFIKEFYRDDLKFDFHDHMMRTLAVDFRKVVGIRWYLWLFVVIFLLLNVAGWNTYFWLSFLPLIVTEMKSDNLEVHDVKKRKEKDHEAVLVKLSNDHFWFSDPAIVLNLIHFILFQNSFEIGFFFWVLFTYGFDSCIINKLGFIIPRLIIGVIVQVLCGYCTLPLYAIVTQMGSTLKNSKIEDEVESTVKRWFKGLFKRRKESTTGPIEENSVTNE
ncbi:mlo-like protein 13 [Fagus crenata]